jgi:hypothetical protein
MIFDTLSGSLTYFCRKRRILSHLEHVFRHSLNVALVHEETGFAFDYHVGYSRMPG